MTYDFNAQLLLGQAGEQELDDFFSRWYIINPATAEQQRQGIDRLFTVIGTRLAKTVEYKSDTTASKTGNAFVEIVSVENEQVCKLGWAHTSQAEILLYFLPSDGLIYVLKMDDLRRKLGRWIQKYKTRYVANIGYKSAGLIVPLREFEHMAIQVIQW